MSHSDSEEKKKAVVTLIASYQVDPAPTLLRGWAIGLEGLTLEQIRGGVRKILQGDHPHLPRPGEFRAIALGGIRSSDEEAEVAWVELDKALGNGSTKPLPQRIKAVCEAMGGGTYLMKLDRKEFDFRRRQFINLYQAWEKPVAAIEAETERKSIAKQAGVDLTMKKVETQP